MAPPPSGQVRLGRHRLWVQRTGRPWFPERRQALVDKLSAA